MPRRIHWRCFHCEKVCKTPEAARLHFGPTIYSAPACKINEAGLRELERMLDEYREEDTDLHRQMARMQSEHQQALQREEEKGYARGLKAQRDPLSDGRISELIAEHDPDDDASNTYAFARAIEHEHGITGGAR